jgi:hypothetical protein
LSHVVFRHDRGRLRAPAGGCADRAPGNSLRDPRRGASLRASLRRAPRPAAVEDLGADRSLRRARLHGRERDADANSKTNDFAPDVSVYPKARDPRTGGRQLEHLAFEVVSTESLSHAGRKAAKLIARGVRRVFAINIERARALEWSQSLETWSVLDSSSHIEDATLALPLPISALLSAAEADGPMARALIAKKTPEIEEAIDKGRQEGFTEGKQEGFTDGKQKGFTEGKQKGFTEGKQKGFTEGKQKGFTEGIAHGRALALVAILDARGIALDGADRARILDEQDLAVLDRWTVRAAVCTDAAQLFEAT